MDSDLSAKDEYYFIQIQTMMDDKANDLKMLKEQIRKVDETIDQEKEVNHLNFVQMLNE